MRYTVTVHTTAVLIDYQNWPMQISQRNEGAVLVYRYRIPIVFITIHGVVTHSLMFRSFVYRYTSTQPEWSIHKFPVQI